MKIFQSNIPQKHCVFIMILTFVPDHVYSPDVEEIYLAVLCDLLLDYL